MSTSGMRKKQTKRCEGKPAILGSGVAEDLAAATGTLRIGQMTYLRVVGQRGSE